MRDGGLAWEDLQATRRRFAARRKWRMRSSGQRWRTTSGALPSSLPSRPTRSSRSTRRCGRTARARTSSKPGLRGSTRPGRRCPRVRTGGNPGVREARAACRRSRQGLSDSGRVSSELRRELLIAPTRSSGSWRWTVRTTQAEPRDRGRASRRDRRHARGGLRCARRVHRTPGHRSRCGRGAATLRRRARASSGRRRPPRAELVRLSRGLTPARLARVVSCLDPVEMMFALKKLRARRAPANQAHVTNLKSPALLAADAAEAAARGFAELETTVESPAMRRSTRSRCSSARRPVAPA